MNVSYIKLLNAFESFANAHLQIKRFESDFAEQMPNFATENEKFPILFVAPDNSIFDENANQFTLTVYCFDVIEKDRSNINTILSDTNTILNDVYRWFKDEELPGIDIIGDAPVSTPLNNALLDYCAGWQMVITFDVDTYGLCEIPLSDTPITPVVDILTLFDFCDSEIYDRLTLYQINCLTLRLSKMYNNIAYTGDIDGINTIFVCTEEIVQIFKGGVLLLQNTTPPEYTLSIDKKTATLNIAPDPAFNDLLTFYANQ